MKTTTFETFAPLFDGFYGTVFEYSNESEDIKDYNEEHNTDLSYDDFNWDYREYEQRVSKRFVNRLESELKAYLPITIEFQQLYSPKEYNFSNDSINIKVALDLSQLLQLIADRKELAANYFESVYTSRSGFISFHSNDVEDWLNEGYIMEDTKHRIGALLDCLCNIELDKEDCYYWCDSEYYISFEPKNELA